jgi:hypothetical protein
MAFLRTETMAEVPVGGWCLAASGPAPPGEGNWREGPRLAVLLRAETAASADPEPRKGRPAAEEDLELRAQLRGKILSVAFPDTPLREAAGHLSDRSGFNILVHPEVFEARSEDELRVQLTVRDVPVDEILRLVASLKGLGVRVRRGVAEFVPPHLLEGAFEKALPVHDLVGFPFPMRAGIPRFLEAAPKEGEGEKERDEDLEHLETLTVESLVSLVRETVAPESWDVPPFRIFCRLRHLIVRNRPEVVKAAEDLLRDLRASSWAKVPVEGAFLEGPAGWLDAAGIRGPTLSPSQCDELEKSIAAGKVRATARFLATGVLNQPFFACGGRQVVHVRDREGPEEWGTGACLDGWCFEARAAGGIGEGRLHLRVSALASDYVAPRDPASEPGSVSAQEYRADLDLVRGGGAILGAGSGAGGHLYVRVR